MNRHALSLFVFFNLQLLSSSLLHMSLRLILKMAGIINWTVDVYGLL